MGTADTYLHTSATMGDHVVEVEAEGIDCGTTTVKGTLGQADAVECFAVEVGDNEVKADECFDVEVYITDKNGNRLPKWESFVEITLSDTEKYIDSTDLREEIIFNNGHSVKGKLNNNAEAKAIITVCGCDDLGELDVVCRSDTLEDDDFALDVINSDPDCIDVAVDENDPCNPYRTVRTSVLDTCGNKLIDQECAEGGWASSCMELSASCGTLNELDSTEKVCADLRNTGEADPAIWDLSECGCGTFSITVDDEPDCCLLENGQTLPICEPLEVNLVGPVDRTDFTVQPEASNQEDFYVSERTEIILEQYDECDQLYVCEDGTVDIKLEGEDCVDTSIQVDSPLELEGKEICGIEKDTPLYKVVIENCAEPDKDGLMPAWTDLPEKDDIVVDKLAFKYSGDSSDTICIYEETEEVVGFDSTDKSWGCRQLNSGDRVFYDSVHDVYLIELNNRIGKRKLNEYDIQRMGGAIIRPGDTKDFYFVLQSGQTICETKDIDYEYYQDYNSPDFIEWDNGAHVRDTIEGSEGYTRRNDDYDADDAPGPYDVVPDPYHWYAVTPDYGFGDRVLHNLGFVKGVARAVFRDLVSENVKIYVDSVEQGSVNFNPQPATQVVAINHGDLSEEEICDSNNKDCRPAMACEGEGYDINLQITDGFQNHVGLDNTKIQLESCLMYPRIVEVGEVELEIWNRLKIRESSNPKDVCFDMDKFEKAVEMEVKQKLGWNSLFTQLLLESDEFQKLVNDLYKSKDVKFVDAATDEYGHDVVYTDSNGQATFRVESDDSSLFGIRSYNTGFRIFTIPVGLDADFFDVIF
ncbi:MAG: hypothetical protein GF411_01815, partial [Candidatus Lokiarchaeota archaeon]|nr:hypothetical protein [Candidatus Woesearchaeota archaeon]MBD3404855.1 hypothetical protein [Candidatus Lokiarchaeota archaeon]